MVQPRLVDTAAWAALAVARKRLAPFWQYGVQILKSAAEEGATLAQLHDDRVEPRGWAAPAFAHTLEAPFAEAPLEVQQCAQELARRDALAAADALTSGLYAEIAAAADFELTATALAHRASFLAHLDGADEVLAGEQITAAMDSVRSCSPAHGAALCRTWLGGWATSHRPQRGWKPCPFGCFAPAAHDVLPQSWAAQSSGAPFRRPSASPRRRRAEGAPD